MVAIFCFSVDGAMSALAPPLAQAPPATSSALSLIACVRDPEDSDQNMAASLPVSASQPPPPAGIYCFYI